MARGSFAFQMAVVVLCFRSVVCSVEVIQVNVGLNKTGVDCPRES